MCAYAKITHTQQILCIADSSVDTKPSVPFYDLGMGKLHLHKSVAYFRVLVWPEVHRVRKVLKVSAASSGPDPFWPHVTIGFDPSDVHGRNVKKGPQSVVDMDSIDMEHLFAFVRRRCLPKKDYECIVPVLECVISHGTQVTKGVQCYSILLMSVLY